MKPTEKIIDQKKFIIKEIDSILSNLDNQHHGVLVMFLLENNSIPLIAREINRTQNETLQLINEGVLLVIRDLLNKNMNASPTVLYNILDGIHHQNYSQIVNDVIQKLELYTNS